MSENVWKKTCRIYRWWDFCDGGKKDPHNTLTNRKHVTGLRESKKRGMVVVPPVSKGGALYPMYQGRRCGSGAIQQAR
jgi:hypothetical protein